MPIQQKLPLQCYILAILPAGLVILFLIKIIARTKLFVIIMIMVYLNKEL